MQKNVENGTIAPRQMNGLYLQNIRIRSIIQLNQLIHPGGLPFPSEYTWDDGQRITDHIDLLPDYEFSLYLVAGALLIGVCAVGITVVVGDDVTGVGTADDALLAPLAKGIEEGLIMIMK